jgi:hypothetical protein
VTCPVSQRVFLKLQDDRRSLRANPAG